MVALFDWLMASQRSKFTDDLHWSIRAPVNILLATCEKKQTHKTAIRDKEEYKERIKQLVQLLESAAMSIEIWYVMSHLKLSYFIVHFSPQQTSR